MNTEHILSEGPLPMRCKHCGFGISTNPGAPLDRIADSVRGFLIMHRRCEKPLEPSEQVELFDALAKKERAAEKPFCNHKFVDSKNCLKCGISFAELKAESLRESQQLNGISATTDEPDPETDPPGRSIEVTCQRCGKTLSELGVNLGGALAHHSACTGPAQWDDPMSHGYGAARDDTPEHDKAELTAIDLASHYDKFVELYPFASTHGALRDVLHSVLTTEQYTRLPHGTVEAWHPSSIVFQETAHWARVELAHANSVGRGEHIAGLTLPAQLKMPAALEKAIAEPKKVRKPRAPKRSRLRAEP